VNGATSPPPWAHRGWSASVDTWVAERLGEAGMTATGPPVVRARPWSIVRSLPTTAGRVHFKATAGLSNDATLTAELARLSPIVLTPIAVDPERGWMLLPDGGDRLREARSGDAWLAAWRSLLPAYAELQVAAAPLVGTLAGAAFDDRPARIPGVLEELLADDDALRRGGPDGITADELAGLRRLVPTMAAVCDELAASGLPDTVQHDDLHDGNVLVNGALHIIDWGDTAIGYPLGTLLVTLNSIADYLSLPVEAPEVAVLQDAYLEPFSDRLPMATLRGLVPLARWAGMVGRARTWRAVLATVRSPEDEGLVFGDRAWLRELLEAAPRIG
jgi:hypothetical protein